MNLSQTVEWVPVGERLPSEWSVPILLASDSWVGIGGQMQKGEFHDLNLRTLFDITHWALPLKHPNELTETPESASLRHYLETL